MIPNTVPCKTVSARSSPATVTVYNLTENAPENHSDTWTYGYPHYNLLNQLGKVFSECSSEGWDGYGAAPVSKETFGYALFLIESLPPGFPTPEIGADSDGHLNFEWYNDPRHLVSVSISPEGKLYYAALIGEEKKHDSVPFTGEIPKKICDIIHEVV
jgi:hypothetical protein